MYGWGGNRERERGGGFKGVKRPPRAQRFLGRESEGKGEEREQREGEAKKKKGKAAAPRRGKSNLRSRAIEVLGK